jgi:hypothetical protein
VCIVAYNLGGSKMSETMDFLVGGACVLLIIFGPALWQSR